MLHGTEVRREKNFKQTILLTLDKISSESSKIYLSLSSKPVVHRKRKNSLQITVVIYANENRYTESVKK